MAEQQSSSGSTRREFLANVLMWGGLAAAYGVLGIESLAFLLPDRLRERTRRLFVGAVESFKPGEVQSVYDLQGSEILVRRGEEGFQAFSTVCPHLGCRVNWEEDTETFFCPCHRGVFDKNGAPVSGPPKDGNQALIEASVTVDAENGTVYLEVKDV